MPGTSGYPLKEYKVYQAVKRGVIDLTPGFTASATLVAKYTTVNFTNTTTGGYVGTSETYHWEFPGATPDTSNQENPAVVYTDCGPHDVTFIVNRGGQIDTLIKTQYIIVGPVINILATPNDSACYYTPITLDATTTGASAYLWTPGGATTPTITLDAATIGTGLHTYSCEVTADQCTNSQTQNIFFDACTGIANVTMELNASIQPNPNNGSFKLVLNSGKNEVVDLKIMNSLGTTVYTENNVAVPTSLVKNLNLNHIASGVYFMVIRNGEKNITQKFIVQ
jgi:PKD repeat protein